jgi:hypothetical protein
MSARADAVVMKASAFSPAVSLGILVLSVSPAHADLAAIDLVSARADGSQGGAISFLPSISRTGRHVAFASPSSDLLPDDTNNHWDVFVKDRTTGVLERVSVDATGQQAGGTSNGNTGSSNPALSGDGR